MRGLSDFIGVYDFSRQITQATGDRVDVTGTAVIERGASGAVYRETGRMVMNGAAFDTQQSYGWREDAGRIFVTFPDARPFHDFDPQHGGIVSEHLCGADTYRGGYDFSHWPCWALTWTVSGPRKDYTSVTRYKWRSQ